MEDMLERTVGYLLIAIGVVGMILDKTCSYTSFGEVIWGFEALFSISRWIAVFGVWLCVWIGLILISIRYKTEPDPGSREPIPIPTQYNMGTEGGGPGPCNNKKTFQCIGTFFRMYYSAAFSPALLYLFAAFHRIHPPSVYFSTASICARIFAEPYTAPMLNA